MVVESHPKWLAAIGVQSAKIFSTTHTKPAPERKGKESLMISYPACTKRIGSHESHHG